MRVTRADPGYRSPHERRTGAVERGGCFGARARGLGEAALPGGRQPRVAGVTGHESHLPPLSASKHGP